MMIMKERYRVEHLHAKEVDAYCGQTKGEEHREEESAQNRKTSSAKDTITIISGRGLARLALTVTIGTAQRDTVFQKSVGDTNEGVKEVEASPLSSLTI